MLAKIFGRRGQDKSEPSGPAARIGKTPLGAQKSAPPPFNAAPPASVLKPDELAADQGFDPYNSGAFRKAKAWEKISKR